MFFLFCLLAVRTNLHLIKIYIIESILTSLKVLMSSNNSNTPSSALPKWIQGLLTVGSVLFLIHLMAKLIEFIFGESEKERMPRIFISHSWRYDKDYWTLIKRFDYYNFEYYNHSVPANKPVDDASTQKIEKALRAKINGCSKVLVLGGNYAKGYWIRREVQIAQELCKEVIAIRPWNQYSIPTYLKENANKILGFNAQCIIEEIKK